MAVSTAVSSAHSNGLDPKDNEPTVWNCVDILSPVSASRNYAMIILNQPITRLDSFLNAWHASLIHICADGGANRLHDSVDPSRRHEFLPHLIKGDLDSLRVDVRTYYESRGVRVKRDGSEYATDLMKCISEVERLEAALQTRLPLLLIGGLSGRIDQTVHTMSLIQKMRRTRPRTYVLSGESLAWILDEANHQTMGQTCGILPVGVDSAHVITKGLKWDIDWQTSFEGDVSTSNHLLPEEPSVIIETSRPVLWCVEVKEGIEIGHSVSAQVEPVEKGTSLDARIRAALDTAVVSNVQND